MGRLEVWMDVRGTDGQYQVSNLGHIRLMNRLEKQRRGSKGARRRIFVCEARSLVCDFESGRFGWLVRNQGDGEWRFIPRDEAMDVFRYAGVPVEVDHSHDAEAEKAREERLRKADKAVEGE